MQKQAWIDKEMPPVEQVSPRVWSVPVPVEGLAIRYTLCYLLANDVGELVVVDPGLDTEIGWRDLVAGIEKAGYALENVRGVLVTHFHLDHIGMASRLVAATGAWFAMSPVEAAALRDVDSVDEIAAAERGWLELCGVPTGVVETMLASTDGVFHHIIAWDRPSILVQDGEELPFPGRRIRAVATPGHTPGHLCLVDVDEGLVFTGDHILPRISPNVGNDWMHGGRNALSDYFDSLERMREWDEFEVCPAHEYRFRGLAARIDALEAGHRARSAEVVKILAGNDALTLWQIAERLTWSRGWENLDGDNLRGALAEASAHIEDLVARDVLRTGERDESLGDARLVAFNHS